MSHRTNLAVMAAMGMANAKPSGIPVSEFATRTKANQATLNNPIFLEACLLAGITPTKRQASKWNNKYGKAYAMRFKARESLYPSNEVALNS